MRRGASLEGRRPAVSRPSILRGSPRGARAPRGSHLRMTGEAVGSHFPSAQERQALEQMHVLLVLEQRAVQRRDQLAWVTFAQLFDAHVFVEQQLEPVEQLGGRRL